MSDLTQTELREFTSLVKEDDRATEELRAICEAGRLARGSRLSARHSAARLAEILREIRDRKLYRDGHATFEDFCLREFGLFGDALSRAVSGQKNSPAKAPVAKEEPPRDIPKGSVVYFMQLGDQPYVKIGFTTNLRRRLFENQTMLPLTVRVLGLVPNATRKTERELHGRFHAKRTRGEWFLLDDEILSFITSNTTQVTK